MRGSREMMTLRECARMETTMCKCAVSNNVCVCKKACWERQPKRRPPGDCGGRRSVWSGGQQDMLRMHGTKIGSVHNVHNQNQSRLTPKGRRGRRRRCRHARLYTIKPGHDLYEETIVAQTKNKLIMMDMQPNQTN